ncbi:MAG TPA: AAA family ATPase [Longimicrobium sp.]|nr:AAA family ATPase [Longimicrobium sp.]
MNGPSTPHVVIIAGPNGAGKSTLAPRLLMQEFGVYTFVNADIVAQGLAAFDPASAAVEAGRVIHRWIAELRAARVDFAFETTLAGQALRRQIGALRQAGYIIHLVYLWLPSAEAAVERVHGRVRVGGHTVPDDDVRRRYDRGLRNFMHVYRQMVSDWRVYDGSALSGRSPRPFATGAGDATISVRDQAAWAALQSAATTGPDREDL